MRDKLTTILEEAKVKVLAKAASISEAEEIRVNLLGKKGQMTEILRSMKEWRRRNESFWTGGKRNQSSHQKMLKSKLDEVKAKAQAAKFEAEKIDVTEPGKPVVLGSKHPITITIEEISKEYLCLWDFQLQRDRRLKQYSTTSTRSMQRLIILQEI